MRTIKILFLIAFILPVSCGFSRNNEAKAGITSLKYLKMMVILENGRKKPLDTFALNILKQFSGRSRYNGKPAIEWLSRVLLDPRQSVNDRIFLINHPEVLHSLGIDSDRNRDRYSYSQLGPVFSRLRNLAFSASKLEKDKRSTVENEIMVLYHKLYLYQQLIESMQFALPDRELSVNSDQNRQRLGLSPSRIEFSQLELMETKDLLKALASDIRKKSVDQRSESENEIITILSRLDELAARNQSLPFMVIYEPGEDRENWISPRELLNQDYRLDKSVKEEIRLLGQISQAFRSGDQKRFDRSLKSFNERALTRLSGKVTAGRISAEIWYNRIDPFYRAEFFYGFSILFLLLSFLLAKNWLYRGSFLLLVIGIALHTYGIISRMVIMSRPPVTNLYETFVFTAWMTVVLGIILELFKKKKIGILTGSISGFILLLIAGKYALEGDTMGMLVAVLDSNFWLATHVITITVGFAGIVISGIIGHVYVFQMFFAGGRKDMLKNTFQSIYATQAFGLIFTFLGTVMGGMWADQSWGRFWGWDPKENGALVVVLWSLILFHARLSKWIKDTGFSLGSVIGTVTVALSWFGINLLGVGLHSYGFTSGIALVLMIFILLEIIFVSTSVLIFKKRIRS